MPLTDLQKKTAQAIVNIFETGMARGDYSSVTLIPGDVGHLAYGRCQTTLSSGNLYLLIKAYCGADGAQFASALALYLPRLARCDTSLDTDISFRTLLREAGADPVMQSEQDQFYNRVFWNPSVLAATACGVTSALGVGVVYDSHVQGAWWILRDKTDAEYGRSDVIGERAWVSDYVNERRNWLADNANPVLPRTVYRMEAFRELIFADKWDLQLALTVRGVLLTAELLLQTPPLRPSADIGNIRLLSLDAPPLHGPDVTALQRALVSAGIATPVNGIFGSDTEAAVKQYQAQHNLTVDGIVGPATRSALGL